MEGGKTVEAESGSAAYTALEASPADAVVSDIRMRNGDGLFLTRKIRDRDFQSPPVLLITGYSDYPPEEVYDAGAEMLLAKPFNMKTLVKAVKDAMTPPRERWSRPAPTASGAIRRDLKKMDLETKAGTFRLGHGGFFLQMERDIPVVGDVVAFTLRFAGDSLAEIAGTGRVTWTRKVSAGSVGAGVGVAFETLDGATLDAVLGRIAELKPKAHIPLF